MLMMDALPPEPAQQADGSPTVISDESERARSAQLPSVEDYKAEIGFRKQVGGKEEEDSTPTHPPPDPDGYDSNDFNTDWLDLDHEEQAALNIGEGEEEDPTKGRCCQRELLWKLLKIFVVALFVTLVVVGSVLVSKNNKSKQQKHDFIKKNGSKRLDDIIDFFTKNEVSTLQDLNLSDSPQHIAAQWMAHGDEAELNVPTDTRSDHARTFTQRYAIAVLYYSLGGPTWTHQMNFLSSEHICTWYDDFEIVSDEYDFFEDDDYISMGIHACKNIPNTNNKATDLVPFSLFLPKNNLAGTIPQEVKVFQHMEVMTLSFNSGLTGKLPEGLSRMPNLRYLALQWCDLSGTLPTWIGSAKGLKYLGLGNNRFEGQIPTELSTLTNLELLALNDNMLLEANIDLFHPLDQIRSLYLEDNAITGTISEALMASWPTIQELDLSNNNISGELPTNFFNHPNQLAVVDLHGNQIQGTIPDIGDATTMELEFLALQDNQLTGSIPNSIINLKRLRHLDLDANNLDSVFNPILGDITTLEYLFLGGNSGFLSNLPNWLFQLTNLRELSLKGGNVKGQIPDALLQLSELELLDLHFNNLSGTIPPVIGLLTNLKHMLLNDNHLEGTVPPEMAELSNLQVLLLNENDLTGDTDSICVDSPWHANLVHFSSDCKSEIVCTCCDVCCDDDDITCGAGEWDAGFDPIYEYGYQRRRYSYDMGSHVVNIPEP